MANLFVRTLNTIFIGVFLFPTFYITLKKVKKKKKKHSLQHFSIVARYCFVNKWGDVINIFAYFSKNSLCYTLFLDSKSVL